MPSIPRPACHLSFEFFEEPAHLSLHHLRARCGVDTPAPLHHDVVFPDAIASRVCDAALVLDWRRDHDGVLMGGSL